MRTATCGPIGIDHKAAESAVKARTDFNFRDGSRTVICQSITRDDQLSSIPATAMMDRNSATRLGTITAAPNAKERTVAQSC